MAYDILFLGLRLQGLLLLFILSLAPQGVVCIIRLPRSEAVVFWAYDWPLFVLLRSSGTILYFILYLLLFLLVALLFCALLLASIEADLCVR